MFCICMEEGFKNNQSDQRFEMSFNDKIAYANYRQDGQKLFIDYVFAPPELRGTGAANALMKKISKYAEDEGLKLVPVCGYAKHWMERFAK